MERAKNKKRNVPANSAIIATMWLRTPSGSEPIMTLDFGAPKRRIIVLLRAMMKFEELDWKQLFGEEVGGGRSNTFINTLFCPLRGTAVYCGRAGSRTAGA